MTVEEYRAWLERQCEQVSEAEDDARAQDDYREADRCHAVWEAFTMAYFVFQGVEQK